MAEYLVDIGIDSISLNPDTVLKTTHRVLALEKRLGRAPRAEKARGRDDVIDAAGPQLPG